MRIIDLDSEIETQEISLFEKDFILMKYYIGDRGGFLGNPMTPYYF